MGRPKEVTDEQLLVVARRCFLERGASVSAAEIGRELGVSHTTIFNRFRSKDELMLAALGPPDATVLILGLERGPDDRPLRDQLVAHAKVISRFFEEIQSGEDVLRAAGIDPSRAHPARTGNPVPLRTYRALTAWLERAQAAGRLAPCDVDTLASSILGALRGWSVSTRVCGITTSVTESDQFVERCIALLWDGVGPDRA